MLLVRIYLATVFMFSGLLSWKLLVWSSAEEFDDSAAFDFVFCFFIDREGRRGVNKTWLCSQKALRRDGTRKYRFFFEIEIFSLNLMKWKKEQSSISREVELLSGKLFVFQLKSFVHDQILIDSIQTCERTVRPFLEVIPSSKCYFPLKKMNFAKFNQPNLSFLSSFNFRLPINFRKIKLWRRWRVYCNFLSSRLETLYWYFELAKRVQSSLEIKSLKWLKLGSSSSILNF